jgi:hypothetical protein
MDVVCTLRCCPFDLGRREAHAVAVYKDVVGGDRLAIDADEIVFGPTVGHTFGEEFRHGRAFGNFNVVGKTAAVVIEIEHLHETILLIGFEIRDTYHTLWWVM